MALSESQRRFALEYAKHPNATEAARSIGLKHPSSQGCRMLKLEKVQQEIDRLRHNVEENAYSFLKSHQLEAAQRLLKIVQEGKDGVAVLASKEILKDVLVSREELTSKSELMVKSPSDAMKELQDAINSLSPEHKKSFSSLGNMGLLPTKEYKDNVEPASLEVPSSPIEEAVNPPDPTPGPTPPDPLHLVSDV